MNSIRIKRGMKALLPSELPLGELAFCTDTRELYVGMGEGQKPRPVTNTEITEHLAEWQGKYQDFSDLFQSKYEGLETEYASELTKVKNDLVNTNEQLEHMIRNSIDVNIKGLGYLAIGDGQTDNTEIFQSACNIAKEKGSVNIIVPDGDYVIKQLLIYPNTKFILSKNAILRRHRDSYMLFCNLKKGEVEYYKHEGGYFILEGGTLHGNWNSSDEGVKYGGETGGFGHLSRFELKDCTIIDGANGDHVFDICGCDNVLIEGNTFLGFHGRGLMTEVIQIDIMMSGAFGTGYYDNTPSRNVVIRNNVFKPNPANSKSIMTIPVGSHGSVDGVYYENIIIENNKFYDVEGNTVSNGITLLNVDGCTIRNNLFEYSNIALTTDIIKLSIANGSPLSFNPFKNVTIENNTLKLTNCTGNYNGLNVYVNPNIKEYWNENIEIKNNDFSNMNVSVTKVKNLKFNNNKNIKSGLFNAIVGGEILKNDLFDCTLEGMSHVEFDGNNLENNISNALTGIIAITSLKYSTNNLTISNNKSHYSGDGNRKLIGFTSGLGIENLVITHNIHENGDLISKANYLSNVGSCEIGFNICNEGSIITDGLIGEIHDNKCKGISASKCNVYYNTVDGGAINNSEGVIYNNTIKNSVGVGIGAGKNTTVIGNTLIDCGDLNRWCDSYYVEDVYYINNTFIITGDKNPKCFIEARHSLGSPNVFASNNIYRGIPTSAYELKIKSGVFLNEGLKKYLQYVDNVGAIQIKEI